MFQSDKDQSMCDPPSPSVVTIPDTIQTTGLCICMYIQRLTSTVVLQVEVDEMPLALHRKHLVTQYHVRILTLPDNHPIVLDLFLPRGYIWHNSLCIQISVTPVISYNVWYVELTYPSGVLLMKPCCQQDFYPGIWNTRSLLESDVYQEQHPNNIEDNYN